MDVLPWIDIGIAVAIFTIIVKLILFPLSKASLLTQVRMKEIEPEVNKIKAEYATDRQTQALKIMQLYKDKKIRPFAGVLLIFIQLPILFALLSVFYKIIPQVNPDFLYGFVSVPVIKTQLLGLVDLTQKSLILALLTGIAQYLQLHFSISNKKPLPVPGKEGVRDLSTDLAVSMGKQMKVMVPILAFVSVYWLIPSKFPQASSIIAIYWMMSSLFTLAQELYIRKKYAAEIAKAQK
jgi:YidC/Oxa1 family membrane protein insertase